MDFNKKTDLLKLVAKKNQELIEKNERLIIYNEFMRDVLRCVDNHKEDLCHTPAGISFLKEFTIISREISDKMKNNVH